MTIKKLLLGSTAVLMTASFAHAADAVVVEPEPTEFVRVCDAYGSGFFFIPGTETCIRFGGYVRSGYEKFSVDGTVGGTLTGGSDLANVATGNVVIQNAGDPAPAVVTQGGSLPVGAIPASSLNGADGVANTADDVALAAGTVATPVLIQSTSSAGVAVNPDFTLWGNRGRLNVDVRSETDWGTLRALYRLEGGQSNVDTDIDLDVALVSLAGFRAGFAGANYWSTNHGFGNVNGEDLATNAGFTIYEGGFYGFDDATILDYTFASDGLSVTVGIEDPRISFGGESILNTTNNGGTDGEVNFYAGLNFTSDFGTFAATAAHDSIAFELDGNGNIADTGGWAYKVSLELDLSHTFNIEAPGAKLTGYYLYDGDYNTDYVTTYRISENPESIYGIAFQTDLGEELELWANYWNAEGGEAVDGLGVQFDEGDTQQYGIGLNWFPAAAPGFHIKTAYIRGEVEDSGSVLFSGAAVPRANFDFDVFTVAVRRDF